MPGWSDSRVARESNHTGNNMVQITQATARLRLFLAEIKNREDQLDGMVRQFRNQLSRLPRQAIYGRTTLDLSLAAMAEIQERLDHTQTTREHLLAIKRRAVDELSALEVTQQVEEAKAALQKLRAKAGSTGEVDAEVAAEIRRLQEFIAESSKRAERAITSGLQESESRGSPPGD